MPLKPVVLIGALSLLVGLLGMVVPPLARLETDVGLHWLFNLRGARSPPEQVVLVGIDRTTARVLGLPDNPRAWPRSYHARLVERLAQLGVRVIVFDVRFEEAKQSEQDRQFARAIAEAGNVVLFQYLELDLLNDSPGMMVNVQRLRRPIPELAEAAAALAPFTLPRGGARIDWAWIFKADAAGLPTIPAVVLQQLALTHWDSWLALLRSRVPGDAMRALQEYGPRGGKPDVAELTRATRTLFLTNPIRPENTWDLRGMNAEERPVIEALLDLYTGPDRRLLDYYGPDRSLRFVPYERVLGHGDDPLPDLSRAVVFVGYTEQVQPEQQDSFYTVFSRASGYPVNGVEIVATTFANLLERRSIEPLPAALHLLFATGWGLALACLFLRLPLALTLGAVPVLAVTLLGGSVYLFSSNGLWLPVVGLLLFQLPVALVGALLWRYNAAHRERQDIRKAFSYFLPQSALDELVERLSPSDTPGKLVYAVCLATDVEHYTELAERIAPGPLRELLNRYFTLLFAPVREHGGTVSDAVGDSTLSLWASTSPNPALHEKAVQAAVEILDAVAAFNGANPDTPLPTRIGVHGGEIALGHVGAQDHFEYRPVGDIVNATSRLEGLCKQLGAYALVSEEIAIDLQTIVTRSLGQFRMVGKQRPIGVHELIGPRERVDAVQQAQLQVFAAALEEFRAGHFDLAAEGFRAVRASRPQDRPNDFFLELSERYAREPPEDGWDGVVLIDRK